MSERPILKPRDDGRWELAEDYGEVPKGFVTDGASVPRFLWWLLGAPFEADTIDGSVNHDFDYRTGARPRNVADANFFGRLLLHGVGVCRAFAYWLGVRCVGWKYYNKKKRKGESS